MKYSNLIQICTYLQNFKYLSHIKRVGDNLFKLCFDGDETLFFDMNKTACNIHKNDVFKENKNYKAPFDTILAKRCVKSKILEIKVPKNNRILSIALEVNASYKRFITHIYFEFTGRFTNVIITDENGVILEALRHFDNDFRSIRVGKILRPLQGIEIKEKQCEKILNFDEFFKSEFQNLNDKKLDESKRIKIASIDKKIDTLNQNLNALESKDVLQKNADLCQKKGDLLKMNLYLLNDYDREILLSDENGKTLKFSIEKSPKLALNEFYLQAKKLRQKSNSIHIEEKNLKDKISFLVALKNLILNASSLEEIEILSPRKKSIKNPKETRSDDIQNFYVGDFKISVGKNEKGNIYLLKNSSKNDFWFHLKDIPSAHVIVKTAKQNLSDEVIFLAAKIVVNFSVSTAGRYAVDYTKRHNVKVKDGAFVNYVNFKTLSVLKP